MVGLENSMDLAEAAKKVKKPKIDNAEKERQKAFLAQLKASKSEKVKASVKPKKGKKMTRAKKDETYYCSICGCEVVCTTSGNKPIVCCEEVMYVC